MKLFFSILLAHLALTASADALYDKIKQRVGNADEFHHQDLRRLGNQTVEVEVYLSGEGETDLASEILCEPWRYGEWAINKINHNPRGGDYRVQVLGLSADPKDKNTVIARFFMKLGVIERPLDRGFKVSCETKDKVTFVKGISMPEEKSMLESAELSLHAYPAANKPGRLWIYVSAKVKLRSWILYEALPEKLLKKETGERALIVLENYQNEEQKRVAAKSSQIPKEKTEEPASPTGSPKK